jgi:hypothetical protein
MTDERRISTRLAALYRLCFPEDKQTTTLWGTIKFFWQTRRGLGRRPLPLDRDMLGRMVREAWVRWAETQPDPKPSWLLPYDDLAEPDKEADRQIGEAVARWTLIHDAAALAASGEEKRG